MKGKAFMPDTYVQIDVKGNQDPDSMVTTCNLYTGKRCITMVISKRDYAQLILDGFFIRDGNSKDSAGILNTTNCFYLQDGEEQKS